MQVINDYTNAFGFFGGDGAMPGKHNSADYISSVKLGDLIEILSKIGQLSGYHRLSPEGHFSCFYGSIVNRTDGTNMGLFLDQGYSNYGIDTLADNTDLSTWETYYDETSHIFYFPIVTGLVHENDSPYVTFDTAYSDSALGKFRPQYYDTIRTGNNYHVRFRILNCIDGTYFSTTDYTSLSDKALRLSVFGVRSIKESDL